MLKSTSILCKNCTKALLYQEYPVIPRNSAATYIPSLASSQPITPSARLFSTTSPSSDSSSNPPKRPSPYRLLQPHTFLTQFAPLHISGWRLDSLIQQERLINPLSNVDDALSNTKINEGQNGDLQDRRLIRAFLMGEGKDGWRDSMRFLQSAGKVIEHEDHHPTIVITPSSDYIPSSTSLQSTQDSSGYIVEISTHTHTPLPPYPIPTKNHAQKIRPGVTTKDVRLAEKLEEVWKEVMGGKEKIEMKKE